MSDTLCSRCGVDKYCHGPALCERCSHVEDARLAGYRAGLERAIALIEEARERRMTDAKDPELTRKIGMAHMHMACAEQCEGLANFIRSEAEKVRNG